MSMSGSSREYPRHPLVGVGAVVFRDNQVLLVRRARAPRQGLWTFPGGLVELGERVYEAARRELWEETGIMAEPVDVVDVFEVVEQDEEGRVRYHYVVLEILMTYVEGEPRAADDAEAVAWFSLRALDDPQVGPGVKEVVEKALLRLGRSAPLPADG